MFDADGVGAISVTVEGGHLSWLERRRLEVHVWREPQDLHARALLYGYYKAHVYDLIFPTEDEVVDAYAWFMQRNPRSWILREAPRSTEDRVAQLWVAHVSAHRTDVATLATAADAVFFARPELSRRYLEQALSLDPTNAAVSYQLAELYRLKWDDLGIAREEAARMTFDLHRRSVEAEADDSVRAWRLAAAGKAALDAGEVAFAERCGSDMLAWARDKTPQEAANELHQGHLLLGRVALRRGDPESAKAHLLAAADVPGSPQLNSFGPNMALAKELLEAGEAKTVLAYFDRLRTFWELGCDGSLDEWAEDVRNGKLPEFGANLVY